MLIRSFKFKLLYGRLSRRRTPVGSPVPVRVREMTLPLTPQVLPVSQSRERACVIDYSIHSFIQKLFSRSLFIGTLLERAQ
jgi:hypothetical protein